MGITQDRNPQGWDGHSALYMLHFACIVEAAVRSFRFDWRWVAVIAFVAILANSRALPWPIPVAALGAAGGYLVYLAWEAWNRTGLRSRGTTRVTYWRGERVEMQRPAPRIRPGDFTTLAPTLVYALVGSALLLAGVARMLRQLGF
jgi:hypothetical protein